MSKLKELRIVFEDPKTGERLMTRHFEVDELLGGSDSDITLFTLTDQLITLMEEEEKNRLMIERGEW